ncbi:MAG TPA: hypothetical protein VMC62_11645 [Longilinea sp.]|nr:hypothetical protein [Longilinea sp.]
MRNFPFFKRSALVLLVFVLIAALIAGCAAPATSEPALTAVLSELSGTVLARDPSQSDFFAAANKQVIVAGSQVKTLEDGRVRLDISNHAIMRLGPNTIFTLLGAVQRSDSLLANIQLAMGQLWVVLMGGYIQIETPQGLAAVRGSYLSVTVVPAVGTYVTCLEGDCNVKNDSGETNLIAGETGTITSSTQAPAMGRMNVQDLDNWLSNVPEASSVLPIANLTQAALPSVTVGPSATPFGATAQPTLTFTPTITASPTATAAFTATATNTPFPFFIFRPTTYVATVAFTATNTPKPKATSTRTPTATPSHDTFFSNQHGPTGSVSSCGDDLFSVKVTDLDGISQAWVYAQVNSGSFSAYPLSDTGGDLWEANVPISACTGDTVTYKFKALDSLGNLTFDTVINSYTLTVDCP